MDQSQAAVGAEQVGPQVSADGRVRFAYEDELGEEESATFYNFEVPQLDDSLLEEPGLSPDELNEAFAKAALSVATDRGGCDGVMHIESGSSCEGGGIDNQQAATATDNATGNLCSDDKLSPSTSTNAKEADDCKPPRFSPPHSHQPASAPGPSCTQQPSDGSQAIDEGKPGFQPGLIGSSLANAFSPTGRQAGAAKARSPDCELPYRAKADRGAVSMSGHPSVSVAAAKGQGPDPPPKELLRSKTAVLPAINQPQSSPGKEILGRRRKTVGTLARRRNSVGEDAEYLDWFTISAKAAVDPNPVDVSPPQTAVSPDLSLAAVDSSLGAPSVPSAKDPEEQAKAGEFSTATEHFIWKSKDYAEKQKLLDERNKEFISNKATADVLSKVRLGYIQIPDFMNHYTKLDQQDRIRLIRRLTSSTLRMHTEVDKQVRLVKYFTEMQTSLKTAPELEELMLKLCQDLMGATGAKMYVVQEHRKRMERLAEPRLNCSYDEAAPRMCIVQTAAQSRMPVTINNALSHHHYNDRWDGPKARSLMCLPIWKNAEPRDGEMVAVWQVYRSSANLSEAKFTRVDETVARLVAMVAGPVFEQLTRVNSIQEMNNLVGDNTAAVRDAGVRCLNVALSEPKTNSSCHAEMTELLKEAETLAALSVQASKATIYFLDTTSMTLFGALPKPTARGGVIQEQFHLVHSYLGQACSTGKPVRIDFDDKKVSSEVTMGRADRARDRMGGEEVHNIIAVPLFISASNSNMVKAYGQTVKPTYDLPVEDTDVLRAFIATEKNKMVRGRTARPGLAPLNSWASIAPHDTATVRHIVGVVQVVNGLTDPEKGPEAGRRFFLEEDEEILKEIVEFIGQMMICILKRSEREQKTAALEGKAQQMMAVTKAIPEFHASLSPSHCIRTAISKARELLHADFVRFYLVAEDQDGVDTFEDYMIDVHSTVETEMANGPSTLHMSKVPALLREALHTRSVTRTSIAELQAGGAWVEGITSIGGRRTHHVMCCSLTRPQPMLRLGVGATAAAAPRKSIRAMMLMNPSDPTAGLLGGMIAGVFCATDKGANLEKATHEMSHEVVISAVARIVGTAVGNALKAKASAKARQRLNKSTRFADDLESDGREGRGRGDGDAGSGSDSDIGISASDRRSWENRAEVSGKGWHTVDVDFGEDDQ